MSDRDWKTATINNNFMFRLVMEKQELCKTLIERVLGIKIKSLIYVEGEKSFEAKLSSRGIRLDLYVVDEDGIAYDIEIQMNSSYREFLGRRTRYYVSIMDGDALKKGDPYRSLRNTYVIFICNFDPFGKGLAKYTFNAICNEDHSIVLDDGVTRVFINIGGDRHRVSKELANIMDYMLDGAIKDDYTRQLEEAVQSLRLDDGKEQLYMTYQQTIMEHEDIAMQKGIALGIEQTQIGMVMNMLKKNMPIEDIAFISGLSINEVTELIKKTAAKEIIRICRDRNLLKDT